MLLMSPNTACPELHWKPLDATIGQLLTPYCSSSRQGNRKHNNNENMHPPCWPFWWPWRCIGRILNALPNRVGPGLHYNQLDTTIGQVLWPIVAIGHACANFIDVFHRQTCSKRLLVDVKAPINNRGMTYQNDEKDLTSLSKYFMRRGGLNKHVIV